MDIKELLMENLNSLAEKADSVRRENVGDIIHIRGLMEFSNSCYRNCDYCGLRAQNNNLIRYNMPLVEMENLAKQAFDTGYKTVVFQSGENKNYNVNEFAKMVERLTNYGLAITLSLGELSFEELKTLKNAGAKRYLLKFETADEKLYQNLHSGYTLKDRLICLENIKKLGYETGSGFLVGLPFETTGVIVKNLQILKAFECDMAGIGVFIPHSETPLKNQPSGSFELTAKCVAITRLLLPKCNIPVTTSLGEMGDKYSAFNFGANVIMVNITPKDYAKNYQIYPKASKISNMVKDRKSVEEVIKKYLRIPL